jgi:hypothetical protein
MEIIAFWVLAFIVYAYFTITTREERRRWWWNLVTVLLPPAALVWLYETLRPWFR